jgi:hypothetical protein
MKVQLVIIRGAEEKGSVKMWIKITRQLNTSSFDLWHPGPSNKTMVPGPNSEEGH